ncbi:MAG: hypothetical protein K0B02_05420 [DPANN group archaeon]|nr:hypothetical protein [DPANN group archaeon]
MDSTFSKEILDIIMTIDSTDFDPDQHILKIRSVCDKYSEVSKYAEYFSMLNDGEIKTMLRFVEKPHGRHHIYELEKMLKDYDSSIVFQEFIKHFYEHEGYKLVHTIALRKLRK